MKEKKITINDYNYELPLNKIANYPLSERDLSKLLVYKNKQCTSSQYLHLASFLPEASLLFFNNTKVIPARLFFKTTTNKDIEIFCLEPISSGVDAYANFAQNKNNRWKCLVGGAAKWKDQFVYLKNDELLLKAEIIERQGSNFILKFSWEPQHKSFYEVLHIAGAIPIPPYLKRATEDIDLERYQTVFAEKEGSVAAPTAGLHFTDRLLETIIKKNISLNYITLHIGAGTFMPVKSELMTDHEMHTEYIEVSLSTINDLYHNDKLITAVGTTSLRTLESLYWVGYKIANNNNITPNDLQIEQWECYEAPNSSITPKKALWHIIKFLEQHQLTTLYAKTKILIVPGYEFKMVNALITNFHQPKSTLILLVAAFIGKDWREVYQYALDNEFRFLSYGDGSLLFRN